MAHAALVVMDSRGTAFTVCRSLLLGYLLGIFVGAVVSGDASDQLAAAWLGLGMTVVLAVWHFADAFRQS